MENRYAVSNVYRFVPINKEELPELRSDLERTAEQLGLFGLLIMADEGLNGTVAGSEQAVQSWKEKLYQLFGEADWQFKDGFSEKNPFKRFKIKVRDEIVTTGAAERIEVAERKNALTPEEWHEVLSSEEDFLLIDTRNYYEVELGRFRGAIDPNLRNFQQFTDFVEQADIPKDKKVLMYCTGGIRCEKAIFEMERRGYQSVFQLEGGILNYLKQYPEEHFEGECFVFDQRVAVKQDLQPSETYVFCPHCGQPGSIEITCERCGSAAKICHRCQPQDHSKSCSKDCRNQLRRMLAAPKHQDMPA